jgi:hypothetical protein
LSLAAALALFAVPAGAQAAGKLTKRADAPARTAVAEKKSELEKRVDEYKDSLKALIPLREKAVVDQTAKVEKIKGLLESGVVSKREVDDETTKLADLQTKLAESQKQLAEADEILEEAEAADQLARAPLPRNGYLATPGVLRYGGSGGWNIADIAKVQMLYTSRFGRQVPISAFGQSATHDHLGFDHRNAVDVAVQPDSAEGQALITYLRGSGIPFLAFRSAVPGKATGPHIHIGLPSHRFR